MKNLYGNHTLKRILTWVVGASIGLLSNAETVKNISHPANIQFTGTSQARQINNLENLVNLSLILRDLEDSIIQSDIDSLNKADKIDENRTSYEKPKNPAEFIDDIKDYAISIQKETGIPASVMMAQAALETGFGENVPGYNFFGIKASAKDKKSEKNFLKSYEYKEGIKISGNHYFKKYTSPRECFEDYSQIITSPRYQKAMNNKNNVTEFIKQLHKSGYASDPNYSIGLNSIIKKYDLTKYDNLKISQTYSDSIKVN